MARFHPTMRSLLAFGLLPLSIALAGCTVEDVHATSPRARTPDACCEEVPLAAPLRAAADRPTLVEWHGSYWPVDVEQRLRDGRALVHYVGWGPEYDELAAPERLRVEVPPDAPPRRGDALYVEWHGSYWPAVVTDVDADGRARIHYDGYGDEWDETVGPERTARLAP